MKYSLLSRFQGCFEGMILADQLSFWISRRIQTATPSATQADWRECADRFHSLSPKLHHWHPSILSLADLAEWQASPGVDLAIQVAEALIQENDWPLQFTPLDTSRLLASGANNGMLAIATLPIAFFFHDDVLLQQQHLRQTVRSWGGTTSTQDWVAMFGYAIAQAMQERLNPCQFITHLLSYWSGIAPDTGQRSPQVLAGLELLNNLIEQGVAYITMTLKLEQFLPQEESTIALALYCFLYTPDDWHLSVLHAARFLPAHPVLCALTGCLSGAYNSYSSLPLTWKAASLQPASANQSSPSVRISCTDLATRLVASWSGIFGASRRPLSANMLPVASPRISSARWP
jgi:hypothetical protein